MLKRQLKNVGYFIVLNVRQTAKRIAHNKTLKYIKKIVYQKWLIRRFWYRKWQSSGVTSKLRLVASVFAGLAVVFILGSTLYQSTFAANIINTWNFSNNSDYSYDGDTIESDGSRLRLKAQNYQTDINTIALFHLDETNGLIAYDSSSNGNNGINLNTTFTLGNLNSGLGFNGVNSKISVADSTSLSFSQANTLEGWTKFDDNFSAGSTSQRQTIYDKGDYQLYFDNETGKVTYELADASADSWTQVGGNDLNGGWDLNGKRSVNALVKMGSNVYAGIGVDIGDAEVWKWDGSTWTMIGGGPQTINNSWGAQTYEGVYALTTDGTNLYAGLGITAGDAEVWKWNGSTWAKIGGDSLNNGWTNYAEQIWTMDYFGGYLYAGIGSSANDAEVWRYDGTNWLKIGGDSVNSGWTTNYEIVGAITDDGTNLYAGLGTTAGDGEVWKWNGSTWLKIGGDSLNSSWDTTIETVRSLRYFGGSLYAGLGDSAGDADVWRWDGSTWDQIGGDGLNSSWSTSYEQVGSFTYDGTNLYVGLGTSDGDGEVWKWNGLVWSKIGGDGLNSSWAAAWGDLVNTMLWDGSKLFVGTYDASGSGWVYTWDGSAWTVIGGNNVNKSWGFYNIAAIQVMQTVGDYLYAGLGNVAGSAEVWRWNGTAWTLVGGQGINSSWGSNTYEQVMSMASYKGKLIVGLGTTAGTVDKDGEIWSWDGVNWSQIGGDGFNSSWNVASHYGEVDSMASDDNYLYAGLGTGSTDGEVWRYNGIIWEKIGGDSINSGWTNYVEKVLSLAIYNGNLVAGLGVSTGDAELWSWNNNSWVKIGGDGIAGSWNSITYQEVESLITYGDSLYAGMGNLSGTATLWEYDGLTWTEVGGDDINGSWTTGTYEKVKTLVSYDGALFVGLGNSAGDGEVWRLSNNVWTKIAGSNLNYGWGASIEEVESFSPYKGKLYVGTGLSGNVDANVWTWGNNGFLQSTKSNFDTNWHHVAATYDGMTMKLYIDGVLDSSKSVTVTIPDSSQDLLIGSSYSGREYGKAPGRFTGQLDELRISNVARTSFTTKPYATNKQTVTLANAAFTSGIQYYSSFSTVENLNGGTISYRLSNDDGVTWQYWDGSNWAKSNSVNDANTSGVINSNIVGFPITFSGIKWQAILSSDGNQRVELVSVTINAEADNDAPIINASNIVAKKSLGGSDIVAGDWTNGASPYFSWNAGSDIGAGILGYCVYLGQDSTANPITTKGFLGNSLVNSGGNCQFVTNDTHLDLANIGILSTPLVTSSAPYYVLVRAIDKAGNIYPSAITFSFRFDNTPPLNPGFISSPAGFINTKEATFTWPTSGAQAPSDSASGLAGLQYKVNNSGWYGDAHNGLGDNTDLLNNDGVYSTIETPDFANIVDGTNTVYFRTWDQAGNISTTTLTAALKINTNGSPSVPNLLTVNPISSFENSFSFSWSAPTTFIGDENKLNYCYTINTLPSIATCNYTGAGITSLSSGPYATQPGSNTLYVVARDESNNIKYDSYSTVIFSANTIAPGLVSNIDIVDVSIKSTNNWRLAITWDLPSDSGSGIKNYKVLRSIDDVNYVSVGVSSSTTYIDAGLIQQTYYYKVLACDSTNNCSANSPSVSLLPTGKFTAPASLIDEPKANDTTTKRARIEWITERTSDSKILIGTASGVYSASEVGNSSQVIIHQIDLDNLAAGTTYYFKAKWTDEDGNTGESQEYTFTTKPAPVVKEIATARLGLSSAVIQFTSVEANKVNLYYGESDSFGGLQSINTSYDEATYSMELTGLKDGTKYYYQLGSFDSEGSEYRGNIFSFTTPPRPRISSLQFQPVEGEPTSTQRVTWTTNVPGSSTVTYGKVGTNGTDIQLSQLVISHTITISGLEDDSSYFLIAQSRDADGNLAVSDRQMFKTALDTRPPTVSDINIESSIRGTGGEARGQIIVSWKTDEPSTSQVAYAEGSTATTFNNKTSEDLQMTTEHIVVLSNLPTSKVYSVQPVSYDKARNIGTGEIQSSIIGRANDSVLTIILSALQKVFGL